MAYREVSVIEVVEVLRQWQTGLGYRRIAAGLGLDRKTVRRYVEAAERRGLSRGGGVEQLKTRRLLAKEPTKAPPGRTPEGPYVESVTEWRVSPQDLPSLRPDRCSPSPESMLSFDRNECSPWPESAIAGGSRLLRPFGPSGSVKLKVRHPWLPVPLFYSAAPTTSRSAAGRGHCSSRRHATSSGATTRPSAPGSVCGREVADSGAGPDSADASMRPAESNASSA
jgi:hypothetical protein